MRYRLRTLLIVITLVPPLLWALPTTVQVGRDFRELNRGMWDIKNSNAQGPDQPHTLAVSLYKIFCEKR